MQSAALGGSQNRVCDVVSRQTGAEVRRSGLTRLEPLNEVSGLVDESVLITNLQARHPPMFHIGMIAIGDVNRAPAARAAFIAMIEILQAMKIMEIPEDRCVLAIDLERIKRFVTTGVACRFKGSE